MKPFSSEPPIYRIPLILAVLLHLLIVFLLIGSLFFHHANQEAANNTNIIQASLISASSLKTQITPHHQAPPKPEIVKAPPAPQEPPKTVVKPLATNQAVEKAVTQSKPEVKIKKASPQKQKSLEQSLLDEEINNTKPIKATKLQNTQADALMAEQLKADSDALKAAQASRSKATLSEIDKYKGIILQQIQQNWIVPQNVQNLSCLLQVDVAPGGMVLNVKLLKSSGNSALDRSAIAAVNKSSPLPVPKDNAAFTAFRSFTIVVKPGGSEMQEM